MRKLPFFEGGPPRLHAEAGSGDALDPDPSCRRCGLSADARSVCVPPSAEQLGEGPTLLVVGDITGHQEALAGKPFVGQAGVMLRQALKRLWKGTVVYTNAVACGGSKGKVTPKVVDACRPYLRQLDADLQPERILALGAHAARAYIDMGLPPFSTRKAYAHTSDGRPVFLVMHPAVTFRNQFVRRWFEEDLAWALRASPRRAPADGACYLLEGPADAQWACDGLREEVEGGAGVLSIDVESYGDLCDGDFRILTIGVSSDGKDSYVWEEGVLGELFGHPALDPLLELVVDPTVPKSAHNAKFDWRAIFKGHGKRVLGQHSCTRLFRKMQQGDAYAFLDDMQTLVGMGGWKMAGQSGADKAEQAIAATISARESARVGALRLRLAAGRLTDKQQAKVASGVETYRKKAQKAYDEGWRSTREDFENAVDRCEAGREPAQFSMAGMDWQTRAKYCAMDTASQRALVDFTGPAVFDEPGLKRVWEEVTRPFQRAIECMESNGLLIDRPALDKLDAHLTDQIREKEKELTDLTTVAINVNAGAQVASVLSDLGAPLGAPGKSGVPCVDKEVLGRLADHQGQPYAEVASRIVQLKRAMKLKSTYVDAVRTNIRDDGRVHSNLKMDGTETGRPSSEGPNVLNFPRPKNEDGKMVRDLIIAAPGWHLLEVDQCCVPGTRVLRADLTWVPVESLGPGDELFAFDEELAGRQTKYRASRVVATTRIRRPVYRVTTDLGVLECSALHGWVRSSGAGGTYKARHWAHTKDLRAGDKVAFLCRPWEVDESWDGGWLAGMLDGEGWCSHAKVGFAQNEGPTLERYKRLLEERGFELCLRHGASGFGGAGASRVLVRGQKADLRLLGMLRPPRLMPKARAMWEGTSTWSKTNRSAVVQSVEFLGEREVCGVQTSTKTLITEGFLTHNSQVEFRYAGILSNDDVIIEMFRSGMDFHLATAKLIARSFKVDPEDVDKDHWLRDSAKTVNFSILYGDTVAGTAAKLNITKDMAADLQESILGQFKALARWIQGQLRDARRLGYCRTYWAGEPALIRPLWKIADVDDDERQTAERSSWNTPVQGTAALVTNASCGALQVELDAMGHKAPAKQVLTIYDSILMEYRDGRLWETVEMAERICTQWHPLLKIDKKRGDAWGSMKALVETDT